MDVMETALARNPNHKHHEDRTLSETLYRSSMNTALT
jgi:hypothetical protein